MTAITRDVRLIVPAAHFDSSNGPHGSAVRTAGAYRVFTETDSELTGDTLHEVIVAAARHLFPTHPKAFTATLDVDQATITGPIDGRYTAAATISLPIADAPTTPQPNPTALTLAAIPDYNTIEDTIPDTFITTEMLRDITDEAKGSFVTITTADNEGTASGILTDYVKEFLHPDATHIEGKIVLFFQGNWSITANLYDNFTTYNL